MQIDSHRGLSDLKKFLKKKIIKLFSLAKKFLFLSGGRRPPAVVKTQHFDSILKCLRVSLVCKQLKWNFSFSP